MDQEIIYLFYGAAVACGFFVFLSMGHEIGKWASRVLGQLESIERSTNGVRYHFDLAETRAAQAPVRETIQNPSEQDISDLLEQAQAVIDEATIGQSTKTFL